ncbi:MAG: gfo/Idh/MocA family oxidoreductase [Verrucomicrobia bacterium]|nr:MAG: gfo/Idh/MocA family oxidoreductase [Verrucomicrobiota bacterium]
MKTSPHTISRRRFITATALAGAAVSLQPRRSFAAATGAPQKIRLGLIGCGGRGCGAAGDALLADPATELVAIADLFQDRLDSFEENLPDRLQRRLRENGASASAADIGEMIRKRVHIPRDRRFVGWDAYQHLCSVDEVDVVLMAAPPVFRPLHLEAALAAGKHVFMEKPVCVDPVGARKMLELADLADARKLCVVAGTQRRHQASYIEGINRLRDGQIGEIVGAQCYWMMGGYVGANLKATEIDVGEIIYQIRNWPLFVWTSGDHIVEQHVHNIDIVLWALGRLPVGCMAEGGRGVDLPMPAYGNRFSHFAAEFDFGDNLVAASYCRQERGTIWRVGERIVGTKGALIFEGRKAAIAGENPWQFEGDELSPYVQEHKDLIAAIRSGEHINETRTVTESCVAAMLGRESAYTGRTIKYDWLLHRSAKDLTPDTWAAGPHAIDPLPIPGKTPLV